MVLPTYFMEELPGYTRRTDRIRLGQSVLDRSTLGTDNNNNPLVNI